MPSSKYLARFSDDDVYTMLYCYHHKGDSLEDLQMQFSIKEKALRGFLEGRYRRECYKNFKTVDIIVQGEE